MSDEIVAWKITHTDGSTGVQLADSIVMPAFFRSPEHFTCEPLYRHPHEKPECPECGALVLYECTACSSSNYPKEWVAQWVKEKEALEQQILEQQIENRYLKSENETLKNRDNFRIYTQGDVNG